MILSPTSFENLCRARRLLAELTDRPVDEVARAAALSPRHFMRVFEAMFGTTPHQYRTRERIELARRLLAAGEVSVTEVCLDVGFSSLGSFSALFRARVGMPPSIYRRRARAMVQVPGTLPERLFPGCLSLMAELPPGALWQKSRSPPRLSVAP